MANSNVTFVGNLTRDPEVKYSERGTAHCSFSIAINDRVGEEERTNFVNVTCFGTLAENVAASLERGQRVLCEGRIDTYKREVEVDGVTRELTMTKYIANSVGPDLRWATAEVTKVRRNVDENDNKNTSSKSKDTSSKNKDDDGDGDDDDEDTESKSKPKPKSKSKSKSSKKAEPVDDDLEDF